MTRGAEFDQFGSPCLQGKVHCTRFLPKRSLHVAVRTVLFLGLVIGSRGASCFAQSLDGLPTPWQQKTFPISWSKDRSPIKVDHGFVLSFRRTIIGTPQIDTIHVNSLADGTGKDLSFWINGALAVWIDNVAVGPTETFIVVGSFLSEKSQGIINFMSEIDSAGRTLQNIDMGTYEPELACAETDGSVWTFGQDWSAEQSDISYSMLRNYSLSGRLLKSYLMNDDLPPVSLNFSTRLHQDGRAAGGIYLRCGDQSVGAYISDDYTWAEVQLKDGTFQVWKIKFPATGHTTGLALLGTHEVYCSFATRQSVIARGLFRLDLRSPKEASWEPIEGTLAFVGEPLHSPPVTVIAGSEGPNLIYLHVPTDFPKSNLTFFWSKLE